MQAELYADQNREEVIKEFGYANTVAREEIIKLLDRVNDDSKLDCEGTIVFWTIIHDWSAEIISQFEKEGK